MRFYLDEHLSPKIAEIARALGVDVITTRDAGRLGTPDVEQLRYAAREGRCIVTQDWSDFIRHTRAFVDRGEAHAGVVCLPPSLQPDDVSGVARALARFASLNQAGLPPYMVDWLSPVRPEE